MRPDDTVGDALRRMDASGGRMVLVTAPDDTLLGVATDGDMRRWIIAGKSLADPLRDAMDPQPHALREGFRRETAEQLMAEGHFECLPVLDDGGRVVDAIWWHDTIEGHPPERREALDLPVVIMAGGKGTRLAPYTNVLPKPLVPIGDTPIAQLIMQRFAEWGCDDFLLMLNHKANLVRAYFADLDMPYRVESVIEESPLGTAGALSLIADRITQTFFFTTCDTLIDTDYASLLRTHRESGNKITLVASMKHFTIPYGVCEVGDDGRLLSISENLPGSPDLHRTLRGRTVRDRDVPGTPHDMTDLVDAYLAEGKRVGVYPVSEGSWLDMGALDKLHEMIERLGTVESD